MTGEAEQEAGRSGPFHHSTSQHPPCSFSCYHLSPWSVWEDQKGTVSLVPERFAADGFVHLTLGLDQLLVPANAYYRGDPRPHVALTVDLAAVDAEVRFDAEPPLYPHLYGPLPIVAVREVRAAMRDPDGTFIAWGPPEPP